MPRYKALFLAGICALVVALSPASRAQAQDDVDSQARIVRISHVQGEVRIDTGHGYESATMNVPVTEGNWLETRSDSWAEVQLEDGSTIRLAPETQIVFSQLARFSSGGTATTVDLDQGEAEFKIAKRDDSEFQVTVKTKTIVLDASGLFRVTSTNSDPLEIVVWKGSVAVKDPDSDGEVAVMKNETFVLDAQDVGRYALDKGTQADELDQWSKERDDYLSTYASSRSTQSPYQYGASDLNQYGQYVDVPGYGNVWQPTGVSLDWDPFENGYWSYSPAFGNYWVSAYPWGWMPFRYGSWVFVNGRGWCWQPQSGTWNRWHRSPRLVNAPPGFHPPAPPPRRVVSGGGRDDVHVQPPRPRTPGRSDGDHGHNTFNRGGETTPQNPGQHRSGAPGRSDGDHGHNTFNRGGENTPPNPDQHQPAAPGRVAGDHGHNTLNGGGAGPENTDHQGGAGRVRRTFSNDDVQTIPPPISAPPVPAQAQPAPGFVPMERLPKVVERNNGTDHSHGVIRSQGNVDVPAQGGGQQPSPVTTRPVETQIDRSRFERRPAQEQPTAPTPPPQPVRQYTPPVQHTAPPPPPPVVQQQTQPVRQYTPPPAPQPRPAPPAAAPSGGAGPKQSDTTPHGRQQR
jgi:hypothetical protein